VEQVEDILISVNGMDMRNISGVGARESKTAFITCTYSYRLIVWDCALGDIPFCAHCVSVTIVPGRVIMFETDGVGVQLCA